MKKQLEKEYIHNNDFFGTLVQKSDEGKVQLKILFWEKLVEGDMKTQLQDFDDIMKGRETQSDK